MFAKLSCVWGVADPSCYYSDWTTVAWKGFPQHCGRRLCNSLQSWSSPRKRWKERSSKLCFDHREFGENMRSAQSSSHISSETSGFTEIEQQMHSLMYSYVRKEWTLMFLILYLGHLKPFWDFFIFGKCHTWRMSANICRELAASLVCMLFQGGCEDTEFPVDLLTELVRAFLAALDTRAQVGCGIGKRIPTNGSPNETT